MPNLNSRLKRLERNRTDERQRIIVYEASDGISPEDAASFLAEAVGEVPRDALLIRIRR